MYDFPNWILFSMIPSIIAIAYIDYLVMNRWWKCDNCGAQNTHWYMWIVPTTLEFLLFIAGIYIGLSIKGGL